MFKLYQKVVCIKRDIHLEHLKIGGTYTIDNLFGDDTISVKELYYTYSKDCFISIQKYRKLKLEKLNYVS